jgi:hypothetical protein
MNLKLVSLTQVGMLMACLVTPVHATTLKPRNPMLFGLTVQFPYHLTNTPAIRMYCGGNKLKAEVDNKGKKLMFAIPEDRYQTFFTLLITEEIQFSTFENTVRYLKVDPKKPYKFYTLALKERIIPQDITTLCEFPKQPKEIRTEYTWDVKEIDLPYADGRIPDMTVILCYNPAFVDAITGGNAVELPTIKIKKNILSLVGSESNLHDASVEMILSSLDYDTLHSTLKQEVRHNISAKTVLTITT